MNGGELYTYVLRARGARVHIKENNGEGKTGLNGNPGRNLSDLPKMATWGKKCKRNPNAQRGWDQCRAN